MTKINLQIKLKEEDNKKLDEITKWSGARNSSETIREMIRYLYGHKELLEKGYNLTYEREMENKKETAILLHYLFKR